jgi:hypothetical protein
MVTSSSYGYPRDYRTRERNIRATASWPDHGRLELGGTPVMPAATANLFLGSLPWLKRWL